MSPDRSAEAALLDEAERTRTQIRQTTSVYPTMTMDGAYAIQSAWLDIKVEARRGSRRPQDRAHLATMQAAMKIPPDSGFLTADMVFEAEHHHRRRSLHRPEARDRACLRARHRPRRHRPHHRRCTRRHRLGDPSIELIAARSFRVDAETGRTRTVLDTISDNAADAGIVCGGHPVGPREVDLRWIGAMGSRNGVIEETGLAGGVLGHPATGIIWLARRCRAGSLARSGQDDPRWLLHPPDRHRSRGRVSLRLR